MPYFTQESLLANAHRVKLIVESADGRRTAAERANFDIFLSHSSLDAKMVNAVDESLRAINYTVYLDRRIDPHLDPKNVDLATVNILRKRMLQSRCLLAATSTNATESRWIPWEMGFMDGLCRCVATLPVLATESCTFKGQEYFGVYPTMQPNRLPDPTEFLVTLATGRRLELRKWANRLIVRQ